MKLSFSKAKFDFLKEPFGVLTWKRNEGSKKRRWKWAQIDTFKLQGLKELSIIV